MDHYEEFGRKRKKKKPYHHPYHTTAKPVVVTTTVGHGTIDFTTPRPQWDHKITHFTTPKPQWDEIVHSTTKPPWDHEVIHSTTASPWDHSSTARPWDAELTGAYGVPDDDIGPDEYPDYEYHSTTRRPKFHGTTFTTARPHFHVQRTPFPDLGPFPPEEDEPGPIYRDEAETMKPQASE